MTSVLLVTLEYPPQIGGIAEYLRGIMDRLPDGSANVIAPEHSGAHAYDVAAHVPIYRRTLTTPWLRPRWLPLAFWVAWICRKERPDVLLVSHVLPAGRVALWQKRRRGIPYAVIIHGMDAALALAAGGRKKADAGRVLRGAALVIANSAYTATYAAAFGVPKERIMVVHPVPGLPLDTVVSAERSAAVRAERGIAPEDFLLVAAGRLVERKGFDDAIRAVAALRHADGQQQARKVRLLIVGDGPDRSRLEGIVSELGMEDVVRFEGPTEQDELSACMAASDAFIMTPRSIGPDVEGFGIVYLEANLLGKPVIGTRTGGVPDAVVHERTGLLAEPGDVPGITAAIVRLMDDSALTVRLGADGRARVLKDFDPDVQAGRVRAALDAIAEEARPVMHPGDLA